MKKIIFPLLFIISLFSLTNCEKEENPEAYEGEWYLYFTAQVDTLGSTISVKQIYNFTKNGFTETYQYKYPDNVYYSMQVYKGELSVETDLMSFKIDEYGVADINGLTNKPTGNISYLKEGDDEFAALFPTIQSRSYKVVFSLDTENEALTFYYDTNGDGDYDDPGEQDEFLKTKK